MLYNAHDEYTLKKEDLDLLAQIKDPKPLNITPQYKQREQREIIEAEKIYSSFLKTDDIELILNKYQYYRPTYNVYTKVVTFSRPLPVKVFTQFKLEVAPCKLNDIRIDCISERDNYSRWNK